MAEVLLDIAQNASIRGMRVDGVDLLSVLDFIAYVCPGRNPAYSKTLWNRWISNDFLKSQNLTFVFPEFHMCNFSGKQRKNTPCMSILGLQKLLLILGSKAAVEFRDRVLGCFNRVLAGDRALIREITANAAQDGPVQQIARAALAEQAAEDRIEAGECLELELAERRLALKRKAAELDLEVAERRMKLKREAEEWELQVADRWMESMERLDPNWRADARLQLEAKNRLCNVYMIEPQLAISAGPVQDAALPSASLTLKEVAESPKTELVGSGAVTRHGNDESIVCEHRRFRLRCIDCKSRANNDSEHGIDKNRICEHRRFQLRCRDCKSRANNDSEHGIDKNRICDHRRFQLRCRDCKLREVLTEFVIE